MVEGIVQILRELLIFYKSDFGSRIITLFFKKGFQGCAYFAEMNFSKFWQLDDLVALWVIHAIELRKYYSFRFIPHFILIMFMFKDDLKYLRKLRLKLDMADIIQNSVTYNILVFNSILISFFPIWFQGCAYFVLLI